MFRPDTLEHGPKLKSLDITSHFSPLGHSPVSQHVGVFVQWEHCLLAAVKNHCSLVKCMYSCQIKNRWNWSFLIAETRRGKSELTMVSLVWAQPFLLYPSLSYVFRAVGGAGQNRAATVGGCVVSVAELTWWRHETSPPPTTGVSLLTWTKGTYTLHLKLERKCR